MNPTPMLCPSPVLWDQSFPRDAEVLTVVGKALGEMQQLLENAKALLALTPMLQLFVLDFDFDRTGPYPLLTIIHSLMVQWCLQPSDAVHVVSTDAVAGYSPHPLPAEINHQGNAPLWAEEAGKLLVLHDHVAPGGGFFIGVACPYGFSGRAKGHYRPEDRDVRKFPLVAKDEVCTLQDAFAWDLPANLHNQSVTFQNAKDHVYVLGGSVADPTSGSHYTVTFARAPRPWVLDYNEDPLKDTFVKQLVPLTGFDFEVIKHVLIYGTFPPRRFRLQ